MCVLWHSRIVRIILAIATLGITLSAQTVYDRYFDEYYFPFNPTSATAAGIHNYDDKLEDYSKAGVQKRVEILKSLANDAQYLIFDEPTAVLTPQEIDELMAVMKTLRDEGRAIVFITHKLREVRAIADDITVVDRKSTRLNSSHTDISRMPSSA